MANSDKDIKITPNTGSANLPKIEFTGADNATKTMSIADSGAISFDGDLTVTGNFTVSGTSTSVDTETVTIDDNIIVLNNNETGTPSENAGIEVERGTSTNTLIRWNETTDRWEFTNNGTNYYNIPLSTEYTNNNGDITSVTAGTALSGGGTSGAVTLNVSGITVSEIAAGSILIAGETFADNDTSLMTAAAINDRIESFGYSTTTGTVTSVSVGTGLDVSNATTTPSISLDLSEFTDMTATMVNTDEFIVLDSGAERRKAASEIGLSIFNNDSGFTTNTGDITGVTAGTLLDGGGTSGSVTLNVDLSELTTSTSDGDGDFFVVVDSVNAQKKLTKGNIAISGFNNDSGFTTNTGTVTSVGITAGTGLSGGGTVTTSGTVSLAVDLSELTDMTAAMVGTDEFIVLDGGADRRKAASEIGLSIFNNDSGFVTTDTNTNQLTTFTLTADSGTNQTIAHGNTLDIAGGTGLSSVVGATDTVTLNLDNTAVTAGSYTSADITVDAQGRITAASSGSGGASAIDDLSDAITTATSNIGLGSGALDSITASSGNYNVALGINAGTAITTGDRNIAIGYQAGDGFDTESDNIAIGYDALGGAIAGAEQNVVIGNYAGDAVTSGDNNVLLGYQAGTAITTGMSNTIIGHKAGTQISSGYNNIAIGVQANRWGNGNDTIAIGYGSFLNADLSGDRNIGIGYLAGNNITSGSGNVVIGNADVSSATGDNQLSISSNSSSSPITWITGDSSGHVSLGNFEFDADQTVGSGQDNYVLTYDHSDGQISLEAAAGGGASVIGDLTDVLVDSTNYIDGFLLQTDSDGSAPTTSFIGDNTGNVGIGKDVFTSMTAGANYNVGIGYEALDALTSGDGNIGIGYQALSTVDTQTHNIGIGHGAGRLLDNGLGNIYLGYWAGAETSNNLSYNIGIGYLSQQKASYGFGRNIAIGQSTLRENINGGRNVAIGDEALLNNTSADGNIGIGYQALHDNTTGIKNLAIGYQALDNADTESNNIAIGYDALGGAIAGGEKNIAIGNNALDSLTSGDQNVAIGYQTGHIISEGRDNVLVGNNAGNSISTGDKSVHVGHYAGYSQNTGDYNVSMGAFSGQNPSTGNVSLGYRAGRKYGGTYNTFLGYETGIQTGDSTTNTGSKNLFLGYQAGDNITTGSNNVIIGGADAPSATGSDQLVIASGDGSPTWITGDSNGNVSFNQLADVITVSTNTTLTQAQSGSYVYWTGGTLTLPDGCAAGTQFTIFNNTQSSATVGLNTNGVMNIGWASNAAVADNDATSYVCTGEAAGASYWVQVGA